MISNQPLPLPTPPKPVAPTTVFQGASDLVPPGGQPSSQGQQASAPPAVTQAPSVVPPPPSSQPTPVQATQVSLTPLKPAAVSAQPTVSGQPGVIPPNLAREAPGGSTSTVGNVPQLSSPGGKMPVGSFNPQVLPGGVGVGAAAASAQPGGKPPGMGGQTILGGMPGVSTAAGQGNSISSQSMGQVAGRPPGPLPPVVPGRPGFPGRPGSAPPPPPPLPPKPLTAPPTQNAPPKPGTSQPVPPGTAHAMAKPKQLPLALLVGVGVIVLGLVGFLLVSFFGGNRAKQSADTNNQAGNNASTSKTGTGDTKPAAVKQSTIVYWGLWEPTEVMAAVIAEFEKANPQYKIDYRKQSQKDYRERLQTAIASGNGPDIFRFHASWVPMLKDELSPLPSKIMSIADFQKTFYPIAYKQLQNKGQVSGIPLMYDGLVLFYNTEMLKTAGMTPPTTWAEMKKAADALTVPSAKSERSSNKLQRGGLAIGNANNVEHFADIVGLLILQNGGDPAKPTSAEVKDALVFYTSFFRDDMVWSESLPSSTVAFAKGDVAMMLAPSWRALEVKALNPNLQFATAPAPKLGAEKISWASYWAEGVSNKSKNQDGAWEFLKFLSSKEIQKKLYAEAAKVRTFGELYSRQDLASELQSDVVLSSFLSDAPYAANWYLNTFTHDNGLNDLMVKYYTDAINGILSGKSVTEVQTTLDVATTQLLRQYGIEQAN